jgi:uncharacterized phage protein gp47/JayE
MAYAPATVGPAGLTIPSYNDILDDNLQGFLNIFGQNQYVGPDSAIYQLLSILSLKQSDVNQAVQLAYNQASPQTAVGAGLDRVVKMNGIARLPYGYSTVQVTVTGAIGTVINNGFAQDSNGNQWALPATVTIPGTGTIDVVATCTTPGNVTVEAGDVSIIASPVGGWRSVTNAGSTLTVGAPVEPDADLRGRQAISVSLPSQSPFDATVAAILSLVGVTRINPIENPTGATDIYGNLPHSITIVVEGGTDLDIATTIFLKKTIGCNTQAATATAMTLVNVTDPETGQVTVIGFVRPVYVPIYVSLSVHPGTGATSTTLDEIQAAVVTYLNSLEIGETVTLSALYAIAMSVNPNLSAPIYSIQALTLGIAPAPVGTADIPLLFYKVAQGITANIVITSV